MTILLIEDTIPLAELYLDYLQGEKLDVTHVTTGEAALDFLQAQTPPIILLDMNLPDMDGMVILQHIANTGLKCCVIVMTAYGSVSRVVDAMRLGAFDYLQKPFDKSRLLLTVRNAMERVNLHRMVADYKTRIGRTEYHGMLGSSAVMQAVYSRIDNVVNSTATVFINGESGTGKELCAEAIHNQSPRRHKDMVVLNCGAIPKDLMESEIFGHKKGAFTGAIADRQGAAQQADGGTLFLDEIGEMDIQLQSKLLRLIQSGSFQQVGNPKTSQVDIRYICATNRNLAKMVAEGQFREDLYYRLNVIPIILPPLRDRGQDKLEIARHFLHHFAKEENKRFRDYAPAVENVILHHPWPGNVRQLQNVIRNVVVLNDGEMVKMDMLPPDFLKQDTQDDLKTADTHADAAPTNHRVERRRIQNIRPLAESERQLIEEAVAACNGNVAQAAVLLAVNPSTLYRKLKSWRVTHNYKRKDDPPHGADKTRK